MKIFFPCVVSALAAGAISFTPNSVQAQQAKPFLLPIQCPAGYVATTVEKGCVRDRTAEISRIKGAEARKTRFTEGSGIPSVPPQASLLSTQASIGTQNTRSGSSAKP